ncbi:MAG: hypothetical protein HOD37_10190 [Bacteroidetes bacterium]|nr:hypothetical protein [Bacteroidota bacterium]
MQKILAQISEKKYGFLGTVAFHMFLVIIFLVFKINVEKQRNTEGIMLDLKTLEELALHEFQNDDYLPDESSHSRNIAINQAEDRIENFDDYQDYQMSQEAVNNVVKDLIQQDISNIIEENNLNPDDTELPDIVTQSIKLYRPEDFHEKQVYEGPTNIYFNLEDREMTRMPVPVYKCEGSGLVHLDIRVTRRGKVELVSVDKASSTTSDPCLIKAAKDAALKTRFNFSTKAPMLQSGTISYNFIAQRE